VAVCAHDDPPPTVSLPLGGVPLPPLASGLDFVCDAWVNLLRPGLASVLLLAACDPQSLPDAAMMSDAGPPDAPTCTVQFEDPTDDALTTFPDSSLLVADPTTETGQRVVLDVSRYADLASRLGGYRATLTDDLSEVDGFGVNAEAFFQFGRAFDSSMLPAPDDDAPELQGLGFVVLSPGPARGGDAHARPADAPSAAGAGGGVRDP
jgi:hypothetical protein